jgi:hypothetical protein
MRSQYVPHFFGETVQQKYQSHGHWLTAGVASSIAWPNLDVCVIYAGDEYFLRGTELNGKPSPPGISVKCTAAQIDEAISKIYRFTSILSWFLDGYVDVSTYVPGSHPFLCGDPRRVFSSPGIAGQKSFNCNYLPIIENENTRKALAFWREGLVLTGVHNGYAFLSFYKVIESQFADKKPDKKKRIDWIECAISMLIGDAAKRVSELRKLGIDVGRHLYESGRCAVAHASLDGEIVDPDIPEDRRRLNADLVIIREIARTYIRDELKVPTSHSLYETRDRLISLHPLFSTRALGKLKRGRSVADISPLEKLKIGVGIWPDGPIPGLEDMLLKVESLDGGIVKVVAHNKRQTVFLVYWLDFPSGRIHTDLEKSGYIEDCAELTEEDVRAYSIYFHRVLANGIAELHCGTLEPIDCEVVIPVNIIPQDPEEATERAIARFRNLRNPSKGTNAPST